jgi:hypothetical protein
MATLYVYHYDEVAGLMTKAYIVIADVPVPTSLPCPLSKHIVHIDFSFSPAFTYRSSRSYQASRS